MTVDDCFIPDTLSYVLQPGEQFEDLSTFQDNINDEDRVRNDPSLQYADEETLQGFIQADIYKRENNGFTNPNYLDRYSLILQFLEREEGHTIIEVGGSPSSTAALPIILSNILGSACAS